MLRSRIFLSLVGTGLLLFAPYQRSFDLAVSGPEIEEVTIVSESGSSLSGWFLKGKEEMV